MALRKYHGTHKLLHNALQIATKAVKACEELLGTSKPKGRPDTDEGWQEWGAKVSAVGGFQKCEARLRCVFLAPAVTVHHQSHTRGSRAGWPPKRYSLHSPASPSSSLEARLRLNRE